MDVPIHKVDTVSRLEYPSRPLSLEHRYSMPTYPCWVVTIPDHSSVSLSASCLSPWPSDLGYTRSFQPSVNPSTLPDLWVHLIEINVLIAHLSDHRRTGNTQLYSELGRFCVCGPTRYSPRGRSRVLQQSSRSQGVVPSLQGECCMDRSCRKCEFLPFHPGLT